MNTKTPYQEGAEAKRSGATWFDCPYTDFCRRSQWFRGWDSARRVEGDGE